MKALGVDDDTIQLFKVKNIRSFMNVALEDAMVNPQYIAR